MSSCCFLLVGDTEDTHLRLALNRILEPLGALEVSRDREAVVRVMTLDYTAILVDASSVDNIGLLISKLRAQCPRARVLVLTGSPTWKRAREAFMSGATDYILKSADADQLRRDIHEGLTKMIQPRS